MNVIRSLRAFIAREFHVRFGKTARMFFFVITFWRYSSTTRRNRDSSYPNQYFLDLFSVFVFIFDHLREIFIMDILHSRALFVRLGKTTKMLSIVISS